MNFIKKVFQLLCNIVIAFLEANLSLLEDLKSFRNKLVFFTCALVVLIILLDRVKFYGLTKPNNYKKMLYFIPLFIISLFNLRRGIHINNPTNEIIFHILTMINIGFLEEMLFRGFLFKMMEKSNVKSAIIVSSITFGIGHIVNLLNGADLIPTLLALPLVSKSHEFC